MYTKPTFELIDALALAFTMASFTFYLFWPRIRYNLKRATASLTSFK